jgi:hypothetical protein
MVLLNPMPDAFSPSFRRLQSDIEAYLTAQGKRTRKPDGLVVFLGYEEALRVMFERYLEHGAFDALVSHFRLWNWESSYDDYLIRLTQALRAGRDWPRLRRLWSAVISKRRRLYNGQLRMQRQTNPTRSAPALEAARERLLESLGRAVTYATEIGTERDAAAYGEVISAVKAGRLA